MDAQLTQEILRLPASERLQLLEELWESLRSEPDALPLTEEQKAELDRRIARYEQDPDSASPWEEVRARLWTK